MKNEKQISIKEVAKMAGVSVATVSRVINNNGRFSEITRKKVMQVIKDSGYRLNMAAKSLREKKSKTIGVIVPYITNELFSEIVLGIEKFFFSIGYSVFICNTSQNPQKEMAYLRILDAKLVDGIICISGLPNIPTDVVRQDIPIVCIDRKPNFENGAYYVESDHYIGGVLATEELINSGAKKILLLTKDKSISVNQQRFDGYKAALKKHSIAFNAERIIRLPGTRSNFEEARDAINYTISKGIEFDGIFATNDWRAYGALTALLQNNIRVPQEVKLVGFDAISVSEYCYPAITTIFQDTKVLAEKAAELLYDLMRNHNKSNRPKHIIIPVSLIKRATT
ncbi:LacI family DNA-binding transcriptional regulator [Pectinatus frisingensis]|uniref:LacI family DNA-binding transcriptional regulator n=1 Tax=Pectinatus frisingensis TaxID=865 RepID=UPI0018C64B0E|nr:LacI family DNA-binding transcriptional regulator [Pectinatus frisingensis]